MIAGGKQKKKAREAVLGGGKTERMLLFGTRR